MIIIPLPVIAVNIVYTVLFLLSVAVLIAALLKKNYFVLLPKVVTWLSILLLALCICSIRTILSSDSVENQNPILTFISFNYIAEIVVAVLILVGVNLFVLKGCKRLSEVSARFALDSMNQKFFSIDMKLNQHEITEEEEKLEKANIRKEINFLTNLDVAAKFLSGTGKAISVLYFVAVAVGTLICIKIRGMTVKESLTSNAGMSLSNLVLFLVPLLLLSFAVITSLQTGEVKNVEKSV